MIVRTKRSQTSKSLAHKCEWHSCIVVQLLRKSAVQLAHLQLHQVRCTSENIGHLKGINEMFPGQGISTYLEFLLSRIVTCHMPSLLDFKYRSWKANTFFIVQIKAGEKYPPSEVPL